MRLIQTNGTVTLSPKGRNEVRFSLPKSWKSNQLLFEKSLTSSY
jgi:hypothetical protein